MWKKKGTMRIGQIASFSMMRGRVVALARLPAKMSTICYLEILYLSAILITFITCAVLIYGSPWWPALLLFLIVFPPFCFLIYMRQHPSLLLIRKGSREDEFRKRLARRYSGVSVIAELALAGYERQGRSVLAMPSERGIIVSEICRARNGLIAPFDHLGFQRDAEIRISDFESGAYLKNPDLYTPIPRGRIFFCPPEGEPLSLARAKDGMIPDIRAVPGYTPDITGYEYDGLRIGLSGRIRRIKEGQRGRRKKKRGPGLLFFFHFSASGGFCVRYSRRASVSL